MEGAPRGDVPSTRPERWFARPSFSESWRVGSGPIIPFFTFATRYWLSSCFPLSDFICLYRTARINEPLSLIVAQPAMGDPQFVLFGSPIVSPLSRGLDRLPLQPGLKTQTILYFNYFCREFPVHVQHSVRHCPEANKLAHKSQKSIKFAPVT